MPVDAAFLKRTLESRLGHRVKIVRFFDFLDDVIANPSPKRSLEKFMKKWRACLHKSSKKLMLVTYDGIWPPKCLARNELQKQEPWEKYIARKYDTSYTHCTVNSQSSPDYQPLNFKDLIQLSFWKEMYDEFGNEILSHIFDKCAMLYDVDEGLYLIIGYPNGIIHKKLLNKDKFEQRMQTVRKNVIPSIQVPAPNKLFNPYQLIRSEGESSEAKVVIEKENFCNPPLQACSHHRDPKVNSPCGAYKRARDSSASSLEQEQEQEPASKKLKMEENRNKNNEMKNEKKGNENRWIRPKPDILQKLKSRRDSTLTLFNLGPVNPITDKRQLNSELNYVWIQNDDQLKSKDKLFVLKQKSSFPVRQPKLPRDWQGLKLPNDLLSVADKHGRVTIYVYIISETLAKELGIRIKPKGRQKKKTLQAPVPSNMDLVPAPVERCKVCDTKILENPQISPMRIEQGNQSMKSIPTCTKHINTNCGRGHTKNQDEDERLLAVIKPFSLNCTLPITTCLYNKSSWSKWPAGHSLAKAMSNLKQDNNIMCIRGFIDSILNTRSCSEAAYRYLMKSLRKSWYAEDNSNPVNSIVLSIVQAHSKFGDVHKLFKNCVSYWRFQYYQKQEKKRQSKNSKALSLMQKQEKEKINTNPNLELGKELEVVDLADSQDTFHTSVSNQVAIISSQSTSKNASDIDIPNKRTTGVSQRRNYELIRKCSGNYAKSRSYRSLKYPVPHNCIMQTLKQIFHIMNLNKLLGSKRNIRGFFKFVRKALILGGSRSSLHLSELMALIHPGDLPLTHIVKCELTLEIFAAKVVVWLFNEYILVLLKTCCYITECSFSRMQLKFFLREAWTSASYKMKTHLVKKGALVLNKSKCQGLPNATLRYVPKQNHSLRSLLITRKSSWSISKEETIQLNIYLHYIDAKINKTRMYLPTTIQHEWRKFYTQWKGIGSPKLFYLRLDIRDAYPSVSLEKLNDILIQAGGDKSHTLIMKRFALIGNNKILRTRESIFDQRNRDNWHSGIHIRPCIAMDLEKDREVDVWKMLNQIASITGMTNVVKVGKNPYEFHYGLPQGWSQSPILCNIYYGYLDSTLYLPYLESNGRLFLRIVDDYLFVTPVASEVTNLMQLMKIGCEKHGIVMNDEKSITNIYVRSDEILTECDCDTITFCGWNFCMTCGHVSRDFKKYSGLDFCSTITFHMPTYVNSPEEFLRHRGTLIVPARVKPILLDPTINCYKRILLTVFEASIVLAFRFYAICRVIYPSLSALKEIHRVKGILSSIHLCCTRLAQYVSRNAEYRGPIFSSQEKTTCLQNCCGTQQPGSGATTPEEVIRNVLSVDSLKFTALYGFRLKLLNHHAVCDKVLVYLNYSIIKLRNKLGDDHCDKIIGIVGSKIPACFSEILI